MIGVMELKKTKDAKFPYGVHLSPGEAGIMAAVTRERLVLATRNGNTTIHEFDVAVSAWDAKTKRSFRTSDPSIQAEQLEEFHGRTDEAMMEIAHSQAVAPFNNRSLARRSTTRSIKYLVKKIHK
jgi:hypothetical protein